MTTAAQPLTTDSVFALVDCESFYCSCERAFDPSLAGVPVGVLSNNDGCIIARSPELKALGVRMGTPYFQVRDRLDALGARLFSSNYALYADMSRRVMATLETFADEIETYSIDEAFLRVPRLRRPDLLAFADAVRRRVLRWTRIPVRIGIGPTKTLAKVAARRAKSEGRPFHALAEPADSDLACVGVGGVWGIGRRYERKLKAHGVTTALELRNMPDAWVRKHLTVAGLRTVHELRGIACLPLELAPPPRQTLTHSRMFGRHVRDLPELEEAMATYASRAAEKLRRHRLVAHLAQAYLTTGAYADRPYSATTAARLPSGTSLTPPIVQAALACLRRVYKPRHRYSKCGVTLLELAPETAAQGGLFAGPSDPKRQALAAAVDEINRTMGAGTVFVARCGTDATWAMKQHARSGRYTTTWSELMDARV